MTEFDPLEAAWNLPDYDPLGLSFTVAAMDLSEATEAFPEGATIVVHRRKGRSESYGVLPAGDHWTFFVELAGRSWTGTAPTRFDAMHQARTRFDCMRHQV